MTHQACHTPGNGGVHCIRDDELHDLQRRQDSQDGINGQLLAELSEIRMTLGKAPDPVAGTPGYGHSLILYRLANHLLTGEWRAPMESLLDESETTKIQSRDDLVKRSRSAEQKVKLALIGLGVTLVSTAGTVLLAYLTR